MNAVMASRCMSEGHLGPCELVATTVLVALNMRVDLLDNKSAGSLEPSGSQDLLGVKI